MSGALHRTGVAGDPASPIHRLDPRAKIVGLAGITVIAVSTPLHAWPAFAACALALAAVAAVARVGPRTVWSRVKVILPLVLFVGAFVPFVRGGPAVQAGPLALSEAGLATFALVSAKATIGAVGAVLLGATTSFPDILHGLERMRAPRLLIVIAGFMYRYVFVIADEARRMRTALVARAYRPRHLGQVAALGRMVTALFLRSYERGERVYVAMLARGYAGTMPRLSVLSFGRADTVFLAALALVARAAARGGGMITARGLRFRYPNGVQGLDGVDLDVADGERVAVLGPNGAGKTTLMLHLNGLLRGEGELDVAGLTDSRELRAAVGLVFQDPDDQLFMPTVGEDVAFGPLNLGLAPERVRSRVAGALAAVRMEHVTDRAPHQLSLGQRRRVAIATVLAMRPELLVLDEPSANLDPRARRELLEILDPIERTMLVVTHDLPFAARLCERAVILSAGRIVADGPCGEILADEDLLAEHDLELPEGFDLTRLATA